MMQKESEVIKEKLDLVDFLRSYMHLSPAGRNFKGVCPFHQEKTPSLIVSPDKKIWKCFGCGEGGDIISFVMKYEHIEFPEALRMLAERAGIPMRALSPTQEREFGILYDIHEAATDFFVSEAEKNKKVQEYLSARKLTVETIREFKIGFNPPGDGVTLFLMQKNFDIRDIQRAGLTQKIRGLHRDRFENRIIFPLYNSFGKVIAFAGRILPGGTPTSNDEAKYLNSPETSIFNKSKTLYGLHRSKMKIGETRTVFIVEGYMDFLMAWQSGIQNAVAVSGTALTHEHLERLHRFADTVLVSFDNDPAGLRALERSMDIFHEFDFHIKAVSLGTAKDPAELCEKNPAELVTAIEKAEPAFEYVFRKYFGDGSEIFEDIAMKKRVLAYLLKKIKRVVSAVEQEIWIKKLARLSDTNESVLWEELHKLQRPPEKKEEERIEIKKLSRAEVLAERLVLFGFAKPEFMSIIKEKNNLFPQEASAHLRLLFDGDQSETFRMQAAHELGEKTSGELEREFQETLRILELESLFAQQILLQKKIRQSELSGNEEGLTVGMNEFKSISQKIHLLQTKKDDHKK